METYSVFEEDFMKKWHKRGKVAQGAEKCGNCKYSDNDLGIFALHCSLITDKDNKVISYNPCHFSPSKWEPRKGGEANAQRKGARNNKGS